MIFYRTKYKDPRPDLGDPSDVHWVWDTTQALAKASRKILADKGMTDIATEDVEVPTSKPELHEWLQGNMLGKEEAGLLL